MNEERLRSSASGDASRSHETAFFDELVTRHVSEMFAIDRPWLRRAVEAALMDYETRYILLVGEPGAGKTAFMASLAAANPAWLRYFIRADNLVPATGGSASAMLLRIGHQLACLRPELFDQSLLEIVVEQLVDEAAVNATVAGVRIKNLRVSPFRRTAIRVRQSIGHLQGNLVGVDILDATLDPRLLEPETLGYLALLDPALALARLHPDEQIVLLIDALDELSAAHGEVSIIDWLEDGEELPANVRIVLTSRPTERLRSFLGIRQDSVREITFDTASPEVASDVRNYAVQLFGTTDIPGAFQPFNVEAAVDALARSANGNFAYLSAYARALLAAIRKDDGALGELLRFEALPSGLDSLYGAFLRRIRRQVERLGQLEIAEPKGVGDEFVPAWEGVGRRLVGILAVARAPLSLEQLRLLGGIRVWPSAAEQVLSHFVPYLDEAPAGFEFFHPSLREFLTSDVRDASDVTVSATEWHRRIVRAYRKEFSHGWDDCDGYGVAFLLHHAIESGRSDETDQLIEDLGFLTVAEPDSVMRASSRVRSDRADDLAAAYGRVANLLRGLSPEERRSFLEMSLLQSGIRRVGEAGIPDPQPRATWRPVWADCELSVRHHSFGGHSEGISAIACGYLGGRPCVATGDSRGGIILSDPLTGTKIGSVPDRRPFRISALAIYSRNGESVLVAGDGEGMVECWDLVDMKRLWGTNGYHWNVRGVAVGTLQGRTIVASCSSGAIYANDLKSGDKVAQLVLDQRERPETSGAHCLTSYDVGRKTMFLAGDGSGVVHLLDFELGIATHQMKVDDSSIEQIEVVAGPNGRRYIACAALGRTITIVDGETLDCVSRVVDHAKPNHLPSIASGTVGAEPVLWSATGSGISAYLLPTAQRVAEVSVDSSDLYPIARLQTGDATAVLLGCAGRNVHAINERELHRSKIGHPPAGSRVTAIGSIGLGGGSFLACGHDDGSIRLRDPASGVIVSTSEWRAPGTIRSIDSAEYEGELILACCFDGGVWISHHRRSMVLANADREDSIRSATLGLVEGRAVLAIGTDKGKIETYALVPTLARLGAIEAAHEWPSPNQADPRIFKSSVSSLEIINDGGQVMLASVGWEDMTIKIWDWRTLRLRSVIPMHSYVMRLASGMACSRSTLVSIGMDLRCRFWDPEASELLREHIDRRVPDTSYPYHSETLWYVDVALGKIGDADIVAVAARDGSVTVIDAESLAVVATPSVGYGVWGQSIALAPSGIVVLAGSRGLTAIKVHDAN
jgi:WD40 repeat protein